MKFFAPVLILFLFLFAVNNSVAQRFHAGFTLGLDATTINGSNLNNHFHKLGFIGGAIVNTAITPKLIAQFELNFIQKGSLQPPDSLGNGYSKIALAYIELPLLLRRRLSFNVRKKPVTAFELEGGIYIGRMISVSSTNYQNANTPTDGLFNRYDVGLLAGLNYVVSKNFYVGIRYSNSVIPAIKRNTPYFNFITYTWNRGNNQVLHFNLKFVFGGVGKKDASPQNDAPDATQN